MKGLYCTIFGHHYEVSKNITYHVREYKCSHCNSQVTTNGNGSLTPLTPKFQEINSVLERIHNRRVSRLKQKETISAKQKSLIDFSPHFS